jgi:hypothetical protein
MIGVWGRPPSIRRVFILRQTECRPTNCGAQPRDRASRGTDLSLVDCFINVEVFFSQVQISGVFDGRALGLWWRSG